MQIEANKFNFEHLPHYQLLLSKNIAFQHLMMSQLPQTQASPIERSEPVDVPSPGYPKLASLMAASAPATIFRKFGELQMISLLRLQARLQDLEQEYRYIRTEDVASGEGGRSGLVKDFRQMQDMAESEDGESEQYDVLIKIQVTLKEYS